MAGDLAKLIVRIQADTESLRRGLDEAESRTNKTVKVLGDLASKMRVPFAYAVAGIKDVVNTAADFEHAMAKVKALAGGTEADFRRLSDAAVELGAKSVFSATQAAQGMQSLAAAGMATGDILTAMPALLDAAAASGADFASTADLLVGTLGGFQLGAEQSAHVADVLAAAANASAISMTDVGNSLKYVGPVATAAGISLEETSAALVILGNAGIKGEQAGTSLRGVLTSIIEPSDQAAGTIRKLGLSFFDANGHMKGLASISAELQAKLGGLTEQQRNQALTTIFGRESLSSMLALMSAGAPTIDKLTVGFENADGMAKAMAETMNDTVTGAFSTLSGAFESLSITLGGSVLPGLKDGTKATAGLVAAFGDLAKQSLPAVSEGLTDLFNVFGIDIVNMIDKTASSIKALAGAIQFLNSLRKGDSGGVMEGTLKILGAYNDVLGADKPPVGKKAAGGLLRGPGGPRADLIPILGSNGEFMINAGAVEHYGVGLFEALNARKLQGGGSLSGGIAAPGSSAFDPSEPIAQMDEIAQALREIGDAAGAEQLKKLAAALARIGKSLAGFGTSAFGKDEMSSAAASKQARDALYGGQAPNSGGFSGTPAAIADLAIREAMRAWRESPLGLAAERADNAARRDYNTAPGGIPADLQWMHDLAKSIKEAKASYDESGLTATTRKGSESFLESGPGGHGEGPDFRSQERVDLENAQLGQVSADWAKGIQDVDDFIARVPLVTETLVDSVSDITNILRMDFNLTGEKLRAIAPHVENLGRVFDGVSQQIGASVGPIWNETVLKNYVAQQDSAINLAKAMEALATGTSVADGWLAELTGSLQTTAPALDLFGEAAKRAAAATDAKTAADHAALVAMFAVGKGSGPAGIGAQSAGMPGDLPTVGGGWAAWARSMGGDKSQLQQQMDMAAMGGMQNPGLAALAAQQNLSGLGAGLRYSDQAYTPLAEGGAAGSSWAREMPPVEVKTDITLELDGQVLYRRMKEIEAEDRAGAGGWNRGGRT